MNLNRLIDYKLFSEYLINQEIKRYSKEDNILLSKLLELETESEVLETLFPLFVQKMIEDLSVTSYLIPVLQKIKKSKNIVSELEIYFRDYVGLSASKESFKFYVNEKCLDRIFIYTCSGT